MFKRCKCDDIQHRVPGGRLLEVIIYELVCAYKLEKHRQQGLVRDGNNLGGSGGGSSRQTRIVSECDPMHPLDMVKF